MFVVWANFQIITRIYMRPATAITKRILISQFLHIFEKLMAVKDTTHIISPLYHSKGWINRKEENFIIIHAIITINFHVANLLLLPMSSNQWNRIHLKHLAIFVAMVLLNSAKNAAFTINKIHGMSAVVKIQDVFNVHHLCINWIESIALAIMHHTRDLLGSIINMNLFQRDQVIVILDFVIWEINKDASNIQNITPTFGEIN